MCLISKLESEFNKKKGTADGLQYRCKQCNSEYLKLHYKNNKSYYKEKTKKRAKETHAAISELKKVPCSDCGQTFPPYVMDFDHMHSKVGSISNLTINRRWSLDRLKEELKKCELVCANCHRIRTHERHSIRSSLR